MIALLVVSAAEAATLTVTSAAGSGAGTLRTALASAAGGDTIVFSTTTFPPGVVTPIELYPGCPTAKNIPTGNGYLVPLVLYGVDGELDVETLTRVRLNGTDAHSVVPFATSRFRVDWDQDGVDDVYVRFRSQDLAGVRGLASTATMATVWADGLPSDATIRFPIGRVGSPADADGDGIHDTCDACDATPTGQFVGPDGCTMTPVPL